MSETVPSPVAPPPSTPGERSSRPPGGARRGFGSAAAHLVAGFVIGSVAPFLVLWTAPAFGSAPYEFEIVDVMPQLVALVALGIALLTRARGFGWLRSSGWFVAAAGLLGVAGLYAQGSGLDDLTLTLALTGVIALSIVGLLLAVARADNPSRWAVAFGLAAGIAGGREAVALAVIALREGPYAGTAHGDDVVFAGLGLVVAAAGLVLLRTERAAAPERDEARRWPAEWWTFVRWPVVALVVASALAVGLTMAWNARLESTARSYIGGVSEQDALALQTQDQIARVGIAVLVAVLLVAAAQRSGGSAVARWVIVAFGAAL
jgi:hypothetical protein